MRKLTKFEVVNYGFWDTYDVCEAFEDLSFCIDDFFDTTTDYNKLGAPNACISNYDGWVPHARRDKFEHNQNRLTAALDYMAAFINWDRPLKFEDSERDTLKLCKTIFELQVIVQMDFYIEGKLIWSMGFENDSDVIIFVDNNNYFHTDSAVAHYLKDSGWWVIYASDVFMRVSNTNNEISFNAKHSNSEKIRIDVWEKGLESALEVIGYVIYTSESSNSVKTTLKSTENGEIILNLVSKYFEYADNFPFYRLNQSNYPSSYCKYSILLLINSNLKFK